MSGARANGSRHLLSSAALITVAFLLAIAQKLPLGVREEWVWRPNELPVRLWPASLAGLGLVVLSWHICRPQRWASASRAGRTGWLALLIFAAFVLQIALLNAAGVPLVSPGAIIASPVATTYYSVSLGVADVRDWVASYPGHMASLPYHARTHPPGAVLFFVALRGGCAWLMPDPPPIFGEIAEVYREFGIGPSATDAAAAIAAALIIPLLGSLSLWPLYLFARQLIGEEAAICALPLAAAMPALLLFGASPDLIVLTIAVTTLWLSYSAWRAGSPIHGLIAGLMLALGLFFSFGLLTLAGWLVLWAAVGAFASTDRRRAARRLLAAAAVGVSGLVLFYLVLFLTIGYRPIAVAREALLAHHGVTTAEAARTYWKWVLMNPIEAAVFAGLPLVVAAVWSLVGRARDPSLGRWRAFIIAWLATCILLDVSGAVRGEVGRIWLFLMWPLALAAAPWLATARARAGVVAVLVLLGVWQTILMRGYLTLYDIF